MIFQRIFIKFTNFQDPVPEKPAIFPKKKRQPKLPLVTIGFYFFSCFCNQSLPSTKRATMKDAT